MLMGLIGVGLFLLQIAFFISCVKWIKGTQGKREKEFVLLDRERGELNTLRKSISADLARAEELSQETLQKLKALASQADYEWETLTSKISEVGPLLEAQSKKIITESLQEANKSSLYLSKLCKQGEHIQIGLEDAVIRSQKLLRVIGSNAPTDELLNDIQDEKYAEARRMLSEGIEAHQVSKKLGITLGEVILISSC